MGAGVSIHEEELAGLEEARTPALEMAQEEDASAQAPTGEAQVALAPFCIRTRLPLVGA
jgi:hypothetical protein